MKRFMAMHLRIFLIVAFAFASFAFLPACQRTLTEPAVEKTNVKSNLSAEKIYPHQKDWTQSGTHGTYFLRGRSSCNACHGEDLAGGTSNVSCSKCHEGFPHKTDWKVGLNHGFQFLKNPASCTSCHGRDFNGGGVQKSCKECHNTFPHDSKWALPSNHGAAFIDAFKTSSAKNEKPACFKCHTDGLTPAPLPDGSASKPHGSNAVVSCKSCHKSFPHPDSQTWQKEHGARFLQNQASCKTCHGEDLQGGSVGKACNSCHEKYPHTKDWAKPTEHGATYVSGLDAQRDAGTKRPKDKQCLFCHTQKEEKPHPRSAQLVSCAQCHVGMPHDKKLPIGQGETKAHADIFARLDKKGRVGLVQQCFKCHSLLTDGGTRRNLPVNDGCNMCHGEPVIKGEQKTTYDPNGNPVSNGEVDVILEKHSDGNSF